MNERDAKLAYDIGVHAGQAGLTEMARIINTLETSEQQLGAAVIASAYMIAKLQTAKKTQDKDSNFAEIIDQATEKFEEQFGPEVMAFMQKQKGSANG